ncbi:MAG: RluA family pseudouridine synthase [Clostridia bacterium]|nr:RluA family pseudouridine synthase [Clostridia bacterium]MDD4685866.1 RluA family pseudouridine synthase [Clostridia bacterium]
MEKKIYLVEKQDAGKRLDLFLQKHNPDFSRSFIKNLIIKGLVLHNNIIKKSGTILKENDKIEMSVPKVESLDIQPESLPLNIVYQDEYLAIIDKPQGMVVHPANTIKSGTLVNALLYHIKDLSKINGAFRPGIVHRLDKNTSGLLVVAKDDNTHKSLAKQIKNQTFVRKYLAILEGNLKQDSGIIETYIIRNPKNRTLKAISNEKIGKRAITEFKVLERFDKNCLVEFNLKTGRTHQIRVQCKDFLHHSIVGDVEYGGSVCKELYKNEPRSRAQYLHSYLIEFIHPKTKQKLVFEAPLPDYFGLLLNKLRIKSES